LTGDVIAIASAIEDGAYFKGSAAFPGDCFRRGNGKRKIDNVSDGIQAEDTGCFLDFLQIFLQDAQRKGAQAFRAGQNDERHSLGILSVSWYPDRSRLPLVRDLASRRCLNQFGDDAQEVFGMIMPLGMERVGDNSARNTIAGGVGSADCHNRDFRKAAAHDRKEFEPRHFRHVEIGDNDVRGRPFHL
jgi:hypothetical protein